jgi:hypothetical protein
MDGARAYYLHAYSELDAEARIDERDILRVAIAEIEKEPEAA